MAGPHPESSVTGGRHSDVLERHYKKLPDDVTKNIGVSGWALINDYNALLH
jgi:hypothetical protein